MKLILNCIILIFINHTLICAQDNGERINLDGVKGFIFNAKTPLFFSIQNSNQRYTPNKKEILTIEKCLTKELHKLYQIETFDKKCRIRKRHLKKYIRQYVGFVNNDGDKIVCINFVWSKNDDNILDKIDTELINVYGGCNRFWEVKYNLSTETFFDFYVNDID